jgi:hypothetical protein
MTRVSASAPNARVGASVRRWWVALLFACAVAHVSRPPLPVHAQATPSEASDEPDEFSREIRMAVDAYDRDDYAVAREHFLRAHEIQPSARTWRGLGMTAFELHLYDDAIRELSFALEDERRPLSPKLREEAELTLRVARRRLASSQADRAQIAATLASPASDPELRAEPQAPVAAPTLAVATMPTTASQTEDHGGSAGLGGQRIAGLVVGSAGIVGLGVAVVYSLRSLSLGRERDHLCPPPDQTQCTPAAKTAADGAIEAGDIATVAWAVGGVGLTTGVVLWLTGGPTEPLKATAKLSVGPTSLALSGSF